MRLSLMSSDFRKTLNRRRDVIPVNVWTTEMDEDVIQLHIESDDPDWYVHLEAQAEYAAKTDGDVLVDLVGFDDLDGLAVAGVRMRMSSVTYESHRLSGVLVVPYPDDSGPE